MYKWKKSEIRGIIREELGKLNEADIDGTKLIQDKIKEVTGIKITKKIPNNNTIIPIYKKDITNMISNELKPLFKSVMLEMEGGCRTNEAGFVALITLKYSYKHESGGSNGYEARYFYDNGSWERQN